MWPPCLHYSKDGKRTLAGLSDRPLVPPRM